MAKNLPSHIDGLRSYLLQDSERNEDLALTYFRQIYGSKFKRQSDDEACGADGYVPGHFVLELKGSTSDWYSALFQGIAYKNKGLSFSVVVVATKHFLALWNMADIPKNILEEIASEKGAPNLIGKKISKKYSDKKLSILKKSSWYRPEIFEPLFLNKLDIFKAAISSFEDTLESKKKIRISINTKNFSRVLEEMKQFFDPKMPIKTVRAFYGMIYGPWDSSSVLNISSRYDDRATMGGIEITNLIPGKRSKFKDFVENHQVELSNGENIDDFFAKYDEALDAVDKDFRIKNGIFFTDLDLSKFVMWLVKQSIPNLGKNYLVIDPACGSGNLVTNWRSPLELRHKIVSEIEPELLYAVEQRMRGDQWHNGKFTVIPKVSENKGLNFLDKTAKEYLSIIREHLAEKSQKPDKPIAFLCNPPYRSDDDQSANAVDYKISDEIISMIDTDASAERFCCFLAQMKLICDQAEQSGFPDESVLLLFTQTAWLTKRPIYSKIRQEIFGSFEDIGGILVNAKEFFDVKGSFPIAFTMWKFKGKHAQLNAERSIPLIDLTHVKKNELKTLSWNDSDNLDIEAQKIISSGKIQHLGYDRETFSGEWVGFGRKNLYRNLTKEEQKDKSVSHLGLPKGDSRHQKKTIYGHKEGTSIGFLLDLTPCRTFIDDEFKDKPWFYLDSRFLKVNTNRCFSGLPDSRAYCAKDKSTSDKLFLWYSVCRTFAQCGYPMWANMLEVWIPSIPEEKRDFISRVSAAIVFAENDCIEVNFPANNPVRNSPEISVTNSLSPLSDTSFWNLHYKNLFNSTDTDLSGKLVENVNAVYKLWEKIVKKNHGRVNCEFERSYFVGQSTLSKFAGLSQIRNYAIESDNSDLLKALDTLSLSLKNLKEDFHNKLISENELNYFGIIPKATNVQKKQKTKFQLVLEKRKAIACTAIRELSDDENLGTVKLAKIIYISDQECELGLEAKYVKDVAGPMDGRMFYNSKIGLFPDQASSDVGNIIEKKIKKNGQEKVFKKIAASDSTEIIANEGKKIFGKKHDLILKIIKLFKPLTTDHSEAVATLYACWNDLILSNKKVDDDEIIKNFYKWNKSKKRFLVKDLHKTLKWMRAKNLIPKGKGNIVQAKATREIPDIPF